MEALHSILKYSFWVGAQASHKNILVGAGISGDSPRGSAQLLTCAFEEQMPHLLYDSLTNSCTP